MFNDYYYCDYCLCRDVIRGVFSGPSAHMDSHCRATTTSISIRADSVCLRKIYYIPCGKLPIHQFLRMRWLTRLSSQRVPMKMAKRSRMHWAKRVVAMIDYLLFSNIIVCHLTRYPYLNKFIFISDILENSHYEFPRLGWKIHIQFKYSGFTTDLLRKTRIVVKLNLFLHLFYKATVGKCTFSILTCSIPVWSLRVIRLYDR